MTLRERTLAVYRGDTPDVVPFMLDLSHWFYHRTRQPWDLSVAYERPERGLVDYHRRAGAGDQVPPGAEEDRIPIMHDLLEEFGARRRRRAS